MPYPMRLVDKSRLNCLNQSEKILQDIRKNVAACQKAHKEGVGDIAFDLALDEHLSGALTSINQSLDMIASERASLTPGALDEGTQ